ncbi:DUF1016 family protein [archaeon]|nr:DUF1016 family protein [archaeon]
MDNSDKAVETRSDGYNHLLKDVKSILDMGISGAYKAVDNIKVQTYWQIGERVVREELQHKDRADYGHKIIEQLAADLSFSRRLMFEILQFYREYPIVHTLCAQLSWSHYRLLIAIGRKEERLFYETQSVRNMWAVRELQKQIHSNLYNRMKKHRKLSIPIPMQSKTYMPEDVFKDIYHFDFLGLEKGYDETELEKGLISNTEKLLLEFGADFSVSGRQRKAIIDGQVHAVDIELYHRSIPCIVLVELKVGRFKGEYIGQMNKYCQSHDIK